MFSDTHFHFRHIVEERGLDGSAILDGLCEQEAFFALDIGTRSDDLPERMRSIAEAAARLPAGRQDAARSLMRLSAGIWPDMQAALSGEQELLRLRQHIAKAEAKGHRICAIGECGLDHHQAEFHEELYPAEKDLFLMQLQLARQLGLPVIVHTRQAYSETLSCIDEAGYHNGIIHCYSYWKEEARQFLDRGWHIAFGGGTTYTKKSKLPQMLELLRFIPDDRLLLETDAPYLAPVPFRGATNTPLLIRHVYEFIAAARSTTARELSEQVDRNIRMLFKI